MKKIILFSFIFLFVNCIFSQTLPTNENYIYSRTYLEPVTIENPSAKQIQNVQYYDGVGRKKQSIAIKTTPEGEDLVIPYIYDGFGRNIKSFLPIPRNTLNGNIQSVSEADVNSYHGTTNAFDENELESYSFGRVKQSAFPGDDWKLNSGHTKRYNYGINKTSDGIKKYTTTTQWDAANKIFISSIPLSGVYVDGELYKYSVTDENNNVSFIFTDNLGNIILQRKDEGTGFADNYYIYNEYNQLAYIISPLAAKVSVLDQNTLDELCYQYRYDDQNRLVEKKLPGKGYDKNSGIWHWESFVYDQADRIVLTQDANQKKESKWMITKYEALGRVAYTGIISGGSRQSMQSQAGNYVITEARSDNGFSKNGAQIYYTNSLFIDINTVLTVNYYDIYPPSTPAVASQILGQNVLMSSGQNSNVTTRGLPVASHIKNIEDDNWTKNYLWYDNEGNNIASHSINHLGGYNKTETLFNFSGQILQNITKHKRLDSDVEKIINETFTYDNQNRLITHKHQIDSNQPEFLTQNEYTKFSQLKSKKVGGVSSSAPLQEENYQYNIRGWMTQINNPNDLSSGDLFGYAIKYTNPENTNLSTGRFNGNIAEIDWKTSTYPNDNKRRYSYTYDQLNRLLQGIYSEPGSSLINNGNYNEQLTYDLNGNIASLKRFSKPSSGTTAEKIDDLIYNYTGNRLDKITLPPSVLNNSSGYNALQNVFAYDSNGNMIKHLDKGIGAITYNLLNLPSTITRGGGQFKNITNYTYRADGTKLKKIYSFGKIGDFGTITNVQTETDYLDGFQYVLETGGVWCIDCPAPSPVLQFVPTSEGYFDYVKNKYIYNYSDHLGNVKLSYMHNGSSIEILEENNYYPFGLKHEGYNTSAGNPSYQYKYNGKELQETGMYDYGARFYMPDIGRWGVADPLAELRPDLTPYRYAFNNPIAFTDPTGMYEDAWSEEGDSYSGYFDFSFHWSNNYSQSYGDSNILSTLGDIFSFQWGIDFGTGFQSGDAGFNNDMMQDIADESMRFDDGGPGDPLYNGKALYGTNYIGPGPDVNPYDLLNNGLKPVDIMDLNAFNHDVAYYKANTGGIKGALLETAVAEADQKLALDALKVMIGYTKGQIDPVTGNKISLYTALIAVDVYNFFTPIATRKLGTKAVNKQSTKAKNNIMQKYNNFQNTIINAIKRAK
ncbi:RHS repeat domain-containing protein [Chryseobacterium scophthalmum]|uniref:RHS repeat domain-containing protein n=1 Tax=Chryseobacterium scophthalmum TaxID=59733 RepID=UPI003D00779D